MVDWKFALMEQPRPHAVAQKQAERVFIESARTRWARALPGWSRAGQVAASWRVVRMARWAGTTGMPSCRLCFCDQQLVRPGLWRGEQLPLGESGVFSRPSLEP